MKAQRYLSDVEFLATRHPFHEIFDDIIQYDCKSEGREYHPPSRIRVSNIFPFVNHRRLEGAIRRVS